VLLLYISLLVRKSVLFRAKSCLHLDRTLAKGFSEEYRNTRKSSHNEQKKQRFTRVTSMGGRCFDNKRQLFVTDRKIRIWDKILCFSMRLTLTNCY
jgi:hypothetical protein